MGPNYRQVQVERDGDIACVRIRQRHLDEIEVHELFDELQHLIGPGGCRRLALSLGPSTPECLYSVFLAKLVTLERLLSEKGLSLKLCECSPGVLEVLEVCGLRDRFQYAATPQEAIAAWTSPN